MFKLIQHKGAMFIEYALLFSFITLGGLVFITSGNGGLANNDREIICKAASMLGDAAGSTASAAKNLFAVDGQGAKQNSYWDSRTKGINSQDGTYGKDKMFCTAQLVDLPPGEYTISFDAEKFKNLTGNKTQDLELGFMGFSNNLDLDSHKDIASGVVTSFDKSNAANGLYTLKTSGDLKLGINFFSPDYPKSIVYDSINSDTLSNAINQSITINAVTK